MSEENNESSILATVCCASCLVGVFTLVPALLPAIVLTIVEFVTLHNFYGLIIGGSIFLFCFACYIIFSVICARVAIHDRRERIQKLKICNRDAPPDYAKIYLYKSVDVAPPDYSSCINP